MDKLNARKGLSLGTGKPEDTEIEVNNGVIDKPKVKWNETTQKWQFSNNGVDFFDFSSNTIISCENILELKGKNLIVGDIVSVDRYYSEVDNGGGLYEIFPSGSFKNRQHEGGVWITLDNELEAKALTNGNNISIYRLGAKGDGINDTQAFIRARQLNLWTIDFKQRAEDLDKTTFNIVGYRPVDSFGKPIEKGFIYNPIGNIEIKMEDMTPAYFNDKSSDFFMGFTNPVSFVFTNQAGKNIVLSNNYNFNPAYFQTGAKIIPENQELVECNYDTLDWSVYTTPDLTGTPSLILNGNKIFYFNTGSGMYRAAYVKSLNNGELLEQSIYLNNGEYVPKQSIIYSMFIDSSGDAI